LNATYAKAKKMTFKEERQLAAEKAKENVKILFSLAPLPAEYIAEINWETVGLCHHIPGGEQSSGIFVMQIGDKLVTVKPGSVSSPGEYFCFLFYQKMGLRIPRLKALLASDAENGYNHMVSAVTKKATFTSEEVKLSFPYLMKANMALLGEFILNQPLNVLSRERVEERLEAISEIGKVLALDLIMNNGDRIPFAHRSDGNANNILFERRTAGNGVHLCFIDNTTTAIVRPKGRKKYLKLVEEIRELVYESDSSLLDVVFRTTPREDIGGMRGVADFFRLHFEIELSEKEKVALVSGFKAGIDNTLDMYRENPNVFHELKDETAEAFRETSGEIHLMSEQGLKTIDPAFYDNIISCFDLGN